MLPEGLKCLEKRTSSKISPALHQPGLDFKGHSLPLELSLLHPTVSCSLQVFCLHKRGHRLSLSCQVVMGGCPGVCREAASSRCCA